jgi:probable DNA repair protein
VPGVRQLSEWSRFISDLLAALGWPGDSELTRSEEAMVDQWKTQLSALSGLGLVSPPVTLPVALGHLRRLLSRPLEKGDWSSPIQVLDAASAYGVEFDSAVVVGMSEESWPIPVRLSPLIPLALQRLHQVPGSTAKSVRAERMRATGALSSSAPQVIATFHERLSPLAADFIAEKNCEIAIWDGRLPQESFPVAPLEQISDALAPPFVANSELRGGTGIIKAQSQCPFRAFAEYRLRARSPEDASFGFDARERGGFVHKALENVWKELGSQSKLRATSPDGLRALVRAAIADAVQLKDAGPLHELSVGTERERLEEVVLEWLQLESARSVPFTVEQTEQQRSFEVPGLSLSMRVDRIDRLNNGKLILIDYKSGKQSRPKLVGARPPEPQLLVYAASLDSPVDGIFFGQVKPRDVRAVGFSRSRHFPGLTAEVKKDWDAYIAASAEAVAALANDFVRGVAEVDPIKGACEYCANKPFCRINECGSAVEEDE